MNKKLNYLKMFVFKTLFLLLFIFQHLFKCCEILAFTSSILTNNYTYLDDALDNELQNSNRTSSDLLILINNSCNFLSTAGVKKIYKTDLIIKSTKKLIYIKFLERGENEQNWNFIDVNSAIFSLETNSSITLINLQIRISNYNESSFINYPYYPLTLIYFDSGKYVVMQVNA